MFKHQKEIVHNHGNGYRDWFGLQEHFSLERESTFIISFNGKGFTVDALFRSLFIEL